MFFGFLVLLWVILSGDFFSVCICKRTFGEITPITILSYGLLVYIAGLLGCLNYGIYIIVVLIFGLYTVSVVVAIYRHSFLDDIKRFANKNFLLFMIVFAIFLVGDYGQLVSGYDDAGHWMDCVKVMTYSGEFYANPATQSTFPTYPPMMAMMQLLVQKLYLLLFGGGFCEWLMILTYHVVLFTLFLPLVACLSFKNKKQEHSKPFSEVLYSLIFCFTICITVTVFYRTAFSKTEIDPFLACEAAVIFLTILYRKKIRFAFLLVCVLLPATALTKDAGLLFAVFGVIYYALTQLVEDKKYFSISIPLFAVIFTKVSWESVIKSYGAIDPKPGSVDWLQYIKVLLGFDQYSEAYKNEAMASFRTSLFERSMILGTHAIQVKYIFVLVALIAVSVLLCVLFKKNRGLLTACILSFACFASFLFGMGGVYIDKFLSVEAVVLASFERYLNTVVCMLAVELVTILFVECSGFGKARSFVYLVPLLCFFLSPIHNCVDYITRAYPQSILTERQPTDDFARRLVDACEPDSRVYFLSQNNYGLDYIYVKFMIRPGLLLQSVAGDDYNWCFVNEADPNNIYFKQMHKEQWQKIIFDSQEYDYVALMKCDEYFQTEFADLFESPDEIAENRIYKVNRDSKKLILIDN